MSSVPRHLDEPIDIDEWIERFNDPEAIARSDQAMADWKHMVAIWAELQSKYPHEFVAMHRGEIVAHAHELSDVQDQLVESGLPHGTAPIQWIHLPGDLPQIL